MELLIFVLNDHSKLDDVLASLYDHGIHGGTVIDSTGMHAVMSDEDTPQVAGVFRNFFGSPSRAKSNTIFTIIEKERIPAAVAAIEAVTGDLNNEYSGVVFSFPLDYVKGINSHHEQ